MSSSAHPLSFCWFETISGRRLLSESDLMSNWACCCKFCSFIVHFEPIGGQPCVVHPNASTQCFYFFLFCENFHSLGELHKPSTMKILSALNDLQAGQDATALAIVNLFCHRQSRGSQQISYQISSERNRKTSSLNVITEHPYQLLWLG